MLKDFKSNLDVTKFWSYLGPFYDKLHPTQRATIEKYWQALADGIESMLYNVNEAYYSQNLNISKGFVEDSFKVFKITKAECVKEKFEPIVLTIESSNSETDNPFEYFVTGIQDGVQTKVSNSIKSALVNFTLNWNALEGITQYYVYKRDFQNVVLVYLITGNTVISDDLITTVADIEPPAVDLTIKNYIYNLGTDYFITIPTLKTVYSNLTLTEGTDFEIKELNKLYLKNTIRKYDEYHAETIIKVPNILKTTYSSLFLEEKYFKEIFKQGFYNSYLKETDALQIKLNDLSHFSKLLHNITLNLIKGCSLARLEKVLNLFYNVPFAYEAGTVGLIETVGSYHEITISGKIYKIPLALSPIVNTGDEIEKYDLLCSGITVDDYISNSVLLALETTGEDYYNTVIASIPAEINNLNYIKGITGFNLLDHLKTILLQPGLKLRTI